MNQDIMTQDIAVIGLSCRLPGGANDPQSLWKMLSEGRAGWGKIPADRFNSEAFYHPDPEVDGSINTQSGHFLDHDLSKFDPAFFGISANEAHTMDPQQRLLLENVYEGLENAGIPLESIGGSRTAVFAAIFSRDYLSMLSKDTADMGKYYMTGVGDAILANRVSYLFDLKGPSVTLDTGCSGSLVAIHLACQSLRLGESNMAIASGVNLILHPDQMIPMSLMHMLNNEGKCYTFDSRGSGYGRGEGVGTVILKRLDDALKAGDNVRAIIRGSGVNSDGKTTGIALPNRIAQEDLARHVYEMADLDPMQTPYIEAHGTGTEAGDIIEVNGIANVFGGMSREKPLYIGSIKSNIGHLEAVSGIAGVLKAIMVLENGKIPPQLNLKEYKKGLLLEESKMNVARILEDWPTDSVLRASVSSFGYGGTNAHLILEKPSSSATNGYSNGHENAAKSTGITNATSGKTLDNNFYLIPLSARSEYSLHQNIDNLKFWASNRVSELPSLEDLEHTLSSRRSVWQWRSSIVVSSHAGLAEALDNNVFRARRAAADTRLVFLFTGQGAQWFGMGRELIGSSEVFTRSLQKSTKILQTLGAQWDLLQELSRQEHDSRVNQSEIGQPASTAIQVALVDHLASVGVRPSAVLGHSSGEIAAAYSAGALTHETALAISYNRSFLSNRSRETVEHPGSMAVVGLSEAEAAMAVSKLKTGVASVACLNDPQSTTISGDEIAIDELLGSLDQSVFKRKLAVDTAYHSYHMSAVAQEYQDSMRALRAQPKNQDVQFVSSVTATNKADDFGPSYWVDNLVSKVRFSDALLNYCREQYANSQASLNSKSHIFVEIGPHSALASPCKRTVQSLKLESFQFSYLPSLVRGRNAKQSSLQLAAKLFEAGCTIDLPSVVARPGAPPKVLLDLPSYAWDKRASYWHESRLSREHRQRTHPSHDLLGIRVVGRDPQEPAWRNILSLESHPWLKEHIVDGFITFPGTGYITMAVEAIRQLSEDMQWPKARQYLLRNVEYVKTLIVPDSPGKIEAIITFHRPRNGSDKSSTGWYEFNITSVADRKTWSDHCSGAIMVEFELPDQDSSHGALLKTTEKVQMLERTRSECHKAYDAVALYKDLEGFGNKYGPSFAVLKDIVNSSNSVVATLVIPDVASCMPGGFQRPHVIHPATIDALLHMQIPLFMQNGGRGSVVPTHIDEFTISASVINNPGDEFLCFGNLTYLDSRNANAEATAFQYDERGNLFPVVTISGGELRGIGESQGFEDHKVDRDNVCQVEWFEHVDFMDPELLKTAGTKLDRKKELLGLEEKEALFTEISTWYIDRAVQEIRTNGLKVPDTYEKWYYAWMQKYNASAISQEILGSLTHQRVQSHLEILDKLGVEGETLSRLGNSLSKITTGQVSSLDLFMEGGLYYRMYSMDPSLQCAKYLSEYIMHLYHERGQLTVLEVGGGTATTTKTLFGDLAQAGVMPFRRYDFTDISAGFFEQAEDAFAKYDGIMRFKMFNAENSPVDQGFEEGTYDLVIAANVIHATSKLSVTLSNVRNLLKPAGNLAMIEVVRVTPAYNTCFGAIPGWWNGVEDGRVDTPLLSIEKWNDRLLGSEFSGVEMALRDSDSPAWMSALIISKVPRKPVAKFPIVKLIKSPYLDQSTITFTEELALAIHAKGLIVSEESMPPNPIDDGAIYVVIDSGSKPLLVNPSALVFESAKALATKAKGLFWLSAQEGQAIRNPEKAFITGFSRSARSEHPDLQMVILDVQEDMAADRALALKAAMEIFDRSFCTEETAPSKNFEYVFSGKTVSVPRLVPNASLNSLYNGSSTIGKNDTEVLFHQENRPLRLHIEKPGLLDTLIFVDDDSMKQPLPADQVEIQVMACGINFKDVFIALGQMKATTKMVGECAGIVTAVGEDWTAEFKVGDRVCAYNGTAYASRTRVSGYTANHIPDSISFDSAAGIPVIFATAHRSLVDVANLQRGETVLIHAGSGGVGQAAIIIAQQIGAEIFTTVGNDSKRRMLITQYGLSEDHIFSTRDRAFKDGLLRLTQGRGVDVVLNSLSGEALQDSWACIAKFGTFVEIGKSDIYKKSLISMEHFDKNVTFCSVDLVVMADFRPRIMRALLEEVIKRFADGRYKPVFPVTVMKLGQIESAFRMIQSRKHTGKIILTAGTEIEVKATSPKIPEFQLDPQGAYVIVGGLGSVGRMLMAHMASHGAKTFIVLTRRILNSQESDALNKDSARMSARIIVKTCDIGSLEEVQEVVSVCVQTLPPVKGVIQAAVVFVDRVLETMTLDDWKKPLVPKYTGTNNLIKAFNSIPLDFFLMLSSCANICGTRGQANYNAGNAYQDALSHLLARSKTHYTTLNLGLLIESEVASHQESTLSLLRQGCIPVTREEFLRLCGYMMSAQARKDGHCQIEMGFNRASLSGKEDLFTLKSSLFNLFPYAKDKNQGGVAGAGKVKNVEDLITVAVSVEEIHGIVSAAITKKMSVLVAQDGITPDTEIADLGVDSLIAIELKNWLNRVFKTGIQTNEILESLTLRSLAAKVVMKSTLCNQVSKADGVASLDIEVAKAPLDAPPTERSLSTIGSSGINGARTSNGLRKMDGSQYNDGLLTYPLPNLANTFDSFMETARAFGNEAEIQETCRAIEEFQQPGSIGQRLQARLREKAQDPNTKNWLADVYAASLWLQPRIPVRPISTFFVSHALSEWQHSQAERAALVSLTAFGYKQDLDSGSIEVEYLNERPQCMDTHHWLFNTYRRPAVPMDIPEKHPGNDFIAVLRHGHLFKIELQPEGHTISFKELQGTFEAILKEPLEPISWASVLTTDDRTSWSQVRVLVKEKNTQFLEVLEKSLFVVCLDDGSPSTSQDRAKAFVLDDNCNRWNDKMLQFIVMNNGVSATFCEHSMMDGPTTNQLNRRIEASILAHKGHDSSGAVPILQYHAFDTTPAIASHIDRCRKTWTASIAKADYDSFTLKTFGTSYLQAHRFSAKSVFQIMIQMAARQVLGRNIPSWDPVLMRSFRHGRLELIQVVTPAVARFCEIAGDTSSLVTIRKKAFNEAVASYTNSVTGAAQGKGWDRHIHALRAVLQKGEKLPSFFTDTLYTRTRPGKLFTSYTVSKDPELGIIWNDPEAYWMHFEPHETHCRFDISHGSGELEVFTNALVEAAEIVKELLGPAPV